MNQKKHYYPVGFARLLAALACVQVALARSSESDTQESVGVPDNSLQYVAVLFRHGARSPVALYPTDKAYWRWPNGLGQLTSKSLRQQYELGKFLRKRYVTTNFLTAQYDHTELFVYTTDFERTFLSAQACLSGLYCNMSTCIVPEKRKGMLLSLDLDVRQNDVDIGKVTLVKPPVPIHVYPNISDKMPCPYFQKLVLPSSINMTLPLDQLNLLGHWTGYRENVSTMLGTIADTLYCLRAHNYSLPEWVTPELYDRLQDVTGDQCETFADIYKPIGVARLQVEVGTVLNDIVKRFNASSSGQASRMADVNLLNDVLREAMHPEALSGLRMAIYSMHDTQLAAALKVLGNCLFGRPQFSSTLLFELHRTSQSSSVEVDDKFVVQVLFVTEKNGVFSAKPLDIDSCPAPCTLRAFRQAVEPFLLSDLRSTCMNGTGGFSWVLSYLTPDDYLMIVYTIFGLIIFLSGLAVGIVIVVVAARCFPCIRSCMARLSSDERQRQRGYRPVAINNEDNGESTDVFSASNGHNHDDLREVDSHERSSVL